MSHNELKILKILILGNKIDKINKGIKCISRKELIDLIGISHTNIYDNILPMCCNNTLSIDQRKETLNELKIKSRYIVIRYIDDIYGNEYNKKVIPIDVIQICIKYSGLIGNLLDNHTNIGIFMCSMITREGIKEAFSWLTNEFEQK